MRAHLESSVSSTQQSPRRFFRHGLHEAGVLYRSIALDRQITRGGNTRCCLICTATLTVLIMIGVFFVILLPACIIQAIVYRRARKDINDMPNYTGVNGPPVRSNGLSSRRRGSRPLVVYGIQPAVVIQASLHRTAWHTRVFPRERVRNPPEEARKDRTTRVTDANMSVPRTDRCGAHSCTCAYYSTSRRARSAST